MWTGIQFPELLFFLFLFFFFVFLELSMWHMEIPRLGVELELQLPAYTRATAMRGLSHVCDLHHSSWQHRILNPLSEVRDRTRVLMDPRQVHYGCHDRNSGGTFTNRSERPGEHDQFC